MTDNTSDSSGVITIPPIIYLIGLLGNSLWILSLVAPVLVVVDRGVIKREAQSLEHKFGGEYLRYKSEVRRWI